MSVVGQVKSAGVLLALAAVAVVGYTVVEGSSSVDRKERAAPPPDRDKDKVYVKLAMIIDDDAKNVSPDTIDVWYYVNGKKYPPHGAFQTKRYFFRTLEADSGTKLRIRAEGQTSGQRVTVSIHYENRLPAVIDVGSCVGLCAAEASGTVTAA